MALPSAKATPARETGEPGSKPGAATSQFPRQPTSSRYTRARTPPPGPRPLSGSARPGRHTCIIASRPDALRGRYDRI